jgi:hypothetical protein
MASSYSDDLRQKAVDAVDRGERKSQVCRYNQGKPWCWTAPIFTSLLRLQK